MTQPLFKKIVIFGVGLIGGSFALALRKAHAVDSVVGFGRSAATLQQAQQLGIIDRIGQDVAAEVGDADLVLLATPVGQMAELMARIAPHLGAHTLITDGGSTKSDVVRDAYAQLGSKVAQFVPAHPIAGDEQSGPAAARAGLYLGKKVVLTPLPENTPQAGARVQAAWQACGANIHQLTHGEHDQVFAAVSHLPHLLSFALAHDLAQRDNRELLLSFAASGFRDSTGLRAGLTGCAVILLVWFAGLRLFGREAANYAAILLGSSMLYVLMGHINTLDMGVTFFLTLGIVGLSLGQTQTDTTKRRNWMLLAWAALGLAVLSKGLMGLVLPGAALFIYAVVQRDFSVFKRMHWLPGLAVFLLITAPWFYLVMKANPEFFQRFFIYEHYTRFTTKDLGRYQPWYYFIPILLAGMLPWTLLMFDSMFRTTFVSELGRDNKLPGTFNAARFLLIWAVFIYLFFTVSGSKLPSYLLPMFPALALLMGKQLVEMNSRRLFWLIAPMLPLMLLAVGFAPFTARLADTPLQVRGYGEYAGWLVAAALIWLLGVIAALVLLRRDNKLVAVLVLALST